MPEALRNSQGENRKRSERGFAFFPPSIVGPEPLRSDELGGHPSSLLAKQEAKLQRDWETVQKAYPGAKFEEYRYYWLLVNTRCFYYDIPLRLEPRDHEDKMILCPWLDYLNHADEGVSGFRLPRC